MFKYRKGELLFYKSSLPKELKKYLKDNPTCEKYVTQFLNDYTYVYTKKKWEKREQEKGFLDIFRREQE